MLLLNLLFKIKAAQLMLLLNLFFRNKKLASICPTPLLNKSLCRFESEHAWFQPLLLVLHLNSL